MSDQERIRGLEAAIERMAQQIELLRDAYRNKAAEVELTRRALCAILRSPVLN